jgi:SAM-dependent methyltransferase
MANRNNKAGTENLITRERCLEQTLQEISVGSHILDADAGELKYKKFCLHLNYVSQDFAKSDGTGDGSGLQTKTWDQTMLDIVSDITSIPQPDGSFNAIMCIEVLEHVPYPVDALKEISRLLHSESYLVLTSPFNSLTHFAPYFYQTGFSRYFYQH